MRPPPRAQDAEDEEEPSDADAGFAKRAGKSGSTYGFKAHVAVDEGSQLVRTALLTPANLNETVVADGLIQGDDGALYADGAYDTHARRALLKARAIKDRIMHRPNQHHPDLPPGQQRRNRFISRIRAASRRSRLLSAMTACPGALYRPRQEPEPSALAVHRPQHAPRRRSDKVIPGVRQAPAPTPVAGKANQNGESAGSGQAQRTFCNSPTGRGLG